MEAGGTGAYKWGMRFRRHVGRWLWLIVLALGARTARADEVVKVERAEPAVEYKRFDPAHLPEPPPPLENGEQAVCVYRFDVETDARYSYAQPAEGAPKGPVTLDVKVVGMNVKLKLTVTIWLPKDAPEKLLEHEEGHRAIAERFYAGAEKTARLLAVKRLGRTFRGEGKDAESAGRAAMEGMSTSYCDDYLKAVNGTCERAQGVYDRVTDHGRRGSPTAKEGVEIAVKEIDVKGQKPNGKSQE
jgi:hypothetical protein